MILMPLRGGESVAARFARAGAFILVLASGVASALNAPVIGVPAVNSISGLSPVVSGDGADPFATVTVKEGAVTLCTTSAGTGGDWSCTVTLAAGTHTVSVTQTDGASNTSPAATRVIVAASLADLVNVSSVSVGANQTCVVTTTGGVKCWGFNGQGQLGNPVPSFSPAPVDVTGLSGGVTAVATGTSHACALMQSGGVKCWGRNANGQLGDGTTTQRNAPVDVQGLASGVAAITAGTNFTCALTTTGGLKCWGQNGNGQLGDGTTTNRTSPVDVSGLTTGVAQVSAGGAQTCAVTTTGGAKCWGSNFGANLGDGTFTQRLTPVDVSGATTGVSAVAAGTNNFGCLLRTVGTVACWGNNWQGQLGAGLAADNSTVPVDVPVVSSATRLFAGNSHACAVAQAGRLFCWGDNSYGVLGDATSVQQRTPVEIGNLPESVAVGSAGLAVTCVVTVGGKILCWGAERGVGLLGDGKAMDDVPGPVDVPGVTAATALALGTAHTCALDSSGAAKCWGDNSIGQLGIGSTSSVARAIAVDGLSSGVQAIAAGSHHSCAITSTGSVRCWGQNGDGQLGDSTTLTRLSPVDVTGLSSGAIGLAAGLYHTCALISGGTVKCWGRNFDGQLGNGNTTAQLSPVSVNGLPLPATALAAGRFQTCALLSSGAVYCWGSGAFGALGNGSSATSLSPVPVTGLAAGMTSLTTGEAHGCALDASGGAKCWGWNGNGTLGDGTLTDRLTPVTVTGLASGLSSIAAGSFHTCARTTAGGVKCWGAGIDGQLGDVNLAASPALTPIDVTGLASGTTEVKLGKRHTCAILSGGTVRCWGHTGFNQVGINQRSVRNIAGPVQVVTATLPQAITFNPMADRTFGDAPFTVNATGGESGNAVTFSSTTPSVCTVAGTTVTIVAAGSCTIAANQVGNAVYAAAPQVTQSFNVAKASQAITFPLVAAQVFVLNAQYAVAATATSGLVVTFASDTPSICSVGGTQVTMLAPGTCSITATQAGDGNYGPAPPVTRSIAQGGAAQSITFDPLSSHAQGTSFTVSATASSNLPVTITSLSPAFCTISGNTVTLVATGVCTLAADQAGDATWAPATRVVRAFLVTGLFRAYLSKNGSDTNPCTLQLPCRLLPAAIAAVSRGGEIWMLDSANFNAGPVTIFQTVTILAVPGALGSIVANGGDALVIQGSGTTDVTLRNLVILNLSGTSNTGVNFLQGAQLTVEGCEIYGMATGIDVTAVGSLVTIKETTIRDTTAFAVNARINHIAMLDRVDILNNQVGLQLQDNAQVQVRESAISGNAVGLRLNSPLDGRISSLLVDDTVVSENAVGLDQASTLNTQTTRALLSDSVFTNNTVAVTNPGPGVMQVFTRGNNAFRFNGTNFNGVAPTPQPAQ